jgi:hypothetical protein
MSGKILISLDVANAAMLRNLIFHAWNEQIGVIGSIGDLTVRIAQNDYMNSKVSKSTILNCEFYNGFRGIDIGSNSSVSHTVSVEGCFFNNQTSTGLLTAAETNLINANIFENFANGIWASWASPKTIITNNVLRTNYVGRAINAGGSNITCQGNTIYAALPGTVGTVYLIFGDENTNGGIISNNSIYMTVVGANTIYGIILSSSNKVSVCGNNIYLSNSDTTYNHYGIGISDSDGCLVDGNIINLVNNNAQDIGIWLQSGSENNSGGGATNPSNITHNCGTGVLNEGGGTNSVTSKDV